MRHLLFTFIFALSNVVFAQQEVATPPVAVAAAMSRGAISCSTHKTNLKIEGRVLDDGSAGIKFSYTDGVRFSIKFISKTTAPNGQITIQGQLVTSKELSKAKSVFTMSEEIQNKEYYQEVKFSLYKEDGTTLENKEIIRCTNFRDVAEILQ